MSQPAIPSTSPGTLIPHLSIEGAADAIEFYKKAFGAEELFRMPEQNGKRLMHAHIRIGKNDIFLADVFQEYASPAEAHVSPKSLNGSPVTLHLHVEDADAAFKRAVDAGATITMPIADMFWGDRYGRVRDPFGHMWSIAHTLGK